jgi:predicted nucleic-acid-binding protein
LKSIDTNVLVRYVTRDCPTQSAAVERLLSDSVGTWFVPITVSLELEWVLRSRYKRRAEDVSKIFDDLLGVGQLSLQHGNAIELALDLCEDHSGDFADCLHIALAAVEGNSPLLTFDIEAAGLPGAELLTV